MKTGNGKKRRIYFLAAYIFLIIINIIILVLGVILALRIASIF